MSNYLRKYSTEAEFTAAGIDCKDIIVSYVVENKSVEYAPKYVNGASIKAKSIKLSSSSPIKIEDCQPGNVLCALDDGSYIMTESGSTQGTPIGVCVIPTSHDVYGDGTCAVMSLKAMRYDTPTSGGSEQTIYWGSYNVNVSGCTELVDYNKVVITDNTTTNTLSSQNYGYLPSDKTNYYYSANTITCTNDNDIYYYSGATNYMIPSPYNQDDTRNESFYDTTITSANGLSDFAGFGNTKILTDLSVNQSDWKTAESITNSTGSTTSLAYPAACCCWRYTANGKTDEGMWYLPAIGELAYIMPKWSTIQNTLSGHGVQLLSNNYYWSSSEYSSGIARYVDTYDGYVSGSSKDNYIYVRAFLRVG